MNHHSTVLYYIYTTGNNNHVSRSNHSCLRSALPSTVLCYGMSHGICILSAVRHTPTHTHTIHLISHACDYYLSHRELRPRTSTANRWPPNQLLKPSHTNPASCLPVDPPLARPLDESTRSRTIPHYSIHRTPSFTQDINMSISSRHTVASHPCPSCLRTPVLYSSMYPDPTCTLLSPPFRPHDHGCRSTAHGECRHAPTDQLTTDPLRYKGHYRREQIMLHRMRSCRHFDFDVTPIGKIVRRPDAGSMVA